MRLNGRLTIATVGKIKNRAWLAAQQDYVKRLGRYTTLNLVEVKDVVGRSVPDDVAMAKEGEQLLKVVSDSHRLIALTPTGKMRSSPGLAKWLQKRVVENGRIAFLIGGPLGFSDEVLAACHEEISLSPLTFTHELAHILLLEQLYRACTILAGEQYHK
ncbi:23S rRNA (pseudouridine(1915)-N(3))-methyltransferase RlmH [Candidatus Leptofilum sp.]|uniref:23S rRNA (pseudouridine(1915)-N(3))-methyltransferase RlmH n=1 Tax=Candidatus Leptofilum sp. TaxID=3241576 RepID=UPI003B5A9B0B